MTFFKKRIEQFQKKHHRINQDLYQGLKHGQDPKTLLVICSDSRILPEALLQYKPGEVFVVRNAGNIVPAEPNESGANATIEYALTALDIDNIIICGHTHCGAVTGILNPEAIQDMPTVKAWLSHGPKADQFIDIPEVEDGSEPRLRKAIEANVLLQLEHIQTHEAYKTLCKKKEVMLHGWVYDFESGSVLSYNEDTDKFENLVGAERSGLDASLAMTFLGHLSLISSFAVAVLAVAFLSLPLTILSTLLITAAELLLINKDAFSENNQECALHSPNYA